MSKCRVGHRVLCTRFVNPTYGNQTVGRVLNIDGLGSKPDIVLSEDEVMSGFLRDSLRESHEDPTYGTAQLWLERGYYYYQRDWGTIETLSFEGSFGE